MSSKIIDRLRAKIGQDRLQQVFLGRFRQEVLQCMDIVTGREQGHNTAYSIPEMFPFDYHSLLTLLTIKVQRAAGEIENGNPDATKDSIQDLINYAGFYLAFLQLDKETRTNGLPNTNPTNG